MRDTMATEEFMKLKIAEFPRNIIAGHDVLHNIRGLCDALPFNKKITIIPYIIQDSKS